MRPIPMELDKIESMIGAKEVLELSKELIRIPSVYTKEKEISDFVHSKLDQWGLSPKQVEVEGHGPDVVAEIGDSKLPAIVFNGHMDTVDVMQGWKHDPFGAVIEDDMLYGLGSLDMKCGLASLMIAFRTLADSGMVDGFRVGFQAVTGEEDTGKGTWTMVQRGWFKGAEAAIVGEGFGGLSSITVGRRGGAYYDIEVIGRAAHGAMPHLGVNAISDAAKVISALDSMELKTVPMVRADDGKPLSETQAVLEVVGGGPSLSVPEKCRLKVGRFTVPGGKTDHTEEIKDAISRLGLRSRVEVKMRRGPLDPYEPYATPEDSDLVRAASGSIEHFTGMKPRLVCGLSEADDNLIAQLTRVPVICMGPGEIGDKSKYHQPEEAISVEQLATVPKVYCLTALSIGTRLSAQGFP